MNTPATDPRTFDANSPAAPDGMPFGDLPEWDLTDLYPSTDAKELKRDMDWLEDACRSFAADHEGKLADLDAEELLNAVKRFEQIDIIAGRIMSFAGLRYYQHTTDPERGKFMWMGFWPPTPTLRATNRSLIVCGR
jgi:oligoendopeptidase F